MKRHTLLEQFVHLYVTRFITNVKLVKIDSDHKNAMKPPHVVEQQCCSVQQYETVKAIWPDWFLWSQMMGHRNTSGELEKRSGLRDHFDVELHKNCYD